MILNWIISRRCLYEEVLKYGGLGQYLLYPLYLFFKDLLMKTIYGIRALFIPAMIVLILVLTLRHILKASKLLK